MSPVLHTGKKQREYSRWYDTRPPVKHSLDTIVLFPEPLQIPIAEGTVQLANNRFKADRQMQNLKSVGKDQILSLYKANKKQRKTDQCQHMFRLTRYLLVLPAEKGDDLCEKMTRLMQMVARYLKHCHLHDSNTDITAAKTLIQVFTQKSEHAAQTILTELEHSTEITLETLQTYKALNIYFSNDKLMASD